MANARQQYPFHLIEPKWQRYWQEEQTFRAWNPGASVAKDHPFFQRHAPGMGEGRETAESLPPKFYILDMFPYPSGAGLHVGHPEGYTATDILARYKRACGFNVLHPMGWDAFGLPAEQYAIKTGQHPRKTTEANIATFKRQIQSLGFSYDWSREIDTTDPQYFKWTQWIFLKLYHSWFNPETNKAEPINTLAYPPDLQLPEPTVGRGVPTAPLPPVEECPSGLVAADPELEAKRRAYRDSKRLAFVSEAPMNWCPDLGTVLANEEVINGKSEVGGFPVVRKPMRQWMLRITAYAEKLLNDLELIDWSDSLKEMQRNWIGRSEGAEVDFAIDDCGLPTPHLDRHIRVFTTRPDTLFGATYMVLAPEHRLVDQLFERAKQWECFKGRKNQEITASAVTLVGPNGTMRVVSLDDALRAAGDEREDLIEMDGNVSPPICRMGDYEMFRISLAQHAKEIIAQRTAVEAYRSQVAGKSDLERTELAKEKTGVFTGAYAVNPVHGGMIPIWIADYVLASYGTGAIMAVPGHDTRDFEFATKFNLPIIQVVIPPESKTEWRGFVDDGVATNSMNEEISLDGLPTPEAKKKITVWLESKGLGKKTINFKLRDWLFSRQRYWGEPFPIIWKRDAQGNLYHEAVPESALPLTPPPMTDYKPMPDGEPPLARAKEWVNLPDGSLRETNTMPQWAGSCWYYLRYLDSRNPQAPCDPRAERYWMGTAEISNLKSQISNSRPTPGVDFYVGGTEHAVLHLLYSRFWHKVLFDLSYVSTPEPFYKLVNQGLILGEMEFTAFADAGGRPVSTAQMRALAEEATPQGPRMVGSHKVTGEKLVGRRITEEDVEKSGDGFALKDKPEIRVDARSFKMSKSRGNVINPDDILQEYGADAFRLYEMFMGPLEMVKPWSTKGVEGVYRFLGRVWRLFVDEKSEVEFEQNLTAYGPPGGEWLDRIQLSPALQDTPPSAAQLKILHTCVKKVTEDLDHLRFNTAISAMMVLVNEATGWPVRPRVVLRDFLILLQPFAPHLAEELHAKLNSVSGSPSSTLAYVRWPTYDAQLLVEETIEMPVQVNGKLRDCIWVPREATVSQIEAAALASEKAKPFIEGKIIKKVIVVPQKVVNIAVAG